MASHLYVVSTFIWYLFLVGMCRFYAVQAAVSCDEGYIEAKTHRYRTNITACIHATSESHIQDVILRAINISSTSSSTIRAIGASISYSALGMLDEHNFETGAKYDNVIVINTTENMKQIIDLDTMKNTVTFEAGLRNIEILKYLEDINLTIAYFDGPTYANFVGWFNSGTAGRSGIIGHSKYLQGVMANNVIGLNIVIGNGSVIEITPDGPNSDLLQAVLVSFGSLGVITQVTVKTRPLYYGTKYPSYVIRDMNNSYDIKNTLENVLLPLAYNYTYIYGGLSLFDGTFSTQLHDLFDQETLNLTSNTIKCWTNNDTEYWTHLPCTDIYYKALHMPPTVGNRNLQTEFFVDAEYFVDVFMSIVEYFSEQKSGQTQLWNETYKLYVENGYEIGISFKWIVGDDIWLSVGYNQSQMMQIGISFQNEVSYEIHNAWIAPIYNMLNEKFSDVTPIRCNWAKISLSQYCWLQHSYPKLEEFKQLRTEFDPHNFFLNSFTRDKLGICKENQCCCTNNTCVMDRYDKTNNLKYAMFIIIVSVVVVVAIIAGGMYYCLYKQKLTLKNKENNELANLLK
eukprot:156231_1